MTMDPDLDCVGCQKPFKCCDFQPFIPNYILGAMIEAGMDLADPGEHHYQPVGLVPSRAFRERHARTPEGERGEDLACRYFIDGRCSIYRFRPSECRFFFCEGMTDAHRSASNEGFEFETRTAQRALLRFGFSQSDVDRQVDILNLDAPPVPVDMKDLMDLYRSAWAGQSAAERVQSRA